MRVKEHVQRSISQRALALPDRFYRVRAENYARRLLHRDDGGKYAVVVMAWGLGSARPHTIMQESGALKASL